MNYEKREGEQRFPRICTSNRFLTGVGSGIKGVYSAISLKGVYWKVGETIDYFFLEPPQTRIHREIIEEAMKRISDVCNIKFREAADKYSSDIRISFDPSSGAWSYPGTKALSIPKDKPTLNLGWVDYSTCLHELCHALGMMHEHQHPDAEFEWDERQIHRDMAKSGWSQAAIRTNILQVHDIRTMDASTYDAKSIMHYWFPKRWLKSGELPEKPNIELSGKDVEHLQKLYPFSPKEEEEVKVLQCSADCTNAYREAWKVVFADVTEAYKLNKDTLEEIADKLSVDLSDCKYKLMVVRKIANRINNT